MCDERRADGRVESYIAAASWRQDDKTDTKRKHNTKMGSTTSRTFEESIEFMINAEADEYHTFFSVFAYHEKEKGKEPFVEEVNKCIPALLRRMHLDLNNERLQQGYTNVFRHFSYYGQKVVSQILSFIHERPDDPSVARLGLGLIHDERLYFQDDIENDFLFDIMDIMSRHETDPVVQEYARICVKEYLRGKRRRRDVPHEPRALAPRILPHAMRNHPNNSDVQEVACDTLRCYTEDTILEQLPPGTILQAMNNPAHCAKLQISACNILLQHLLRPIVFWEEVETRLGPVSGRHYVQAILHTMQNHPDNEEVQSTALNVLKALLIGATLTRYQIIEGGGVELVIRATRMIECRDRAIVILECLCESSAKAHQPAIDGGAISILLELLQTTRGPPAVQVKICAFLNYFLLENTDNAVGLQIASEGGVKTIVDVIAKYIRGPPSYHELNDNDILAHLAMFASADGMLPLHYAVSWHWRHNASDVESLKVGRMAVVEHLLKVYPEAATIRDGRGRLPLHAAIYANAPLPVLEALLRINPTSGQAVCHCRDDGMVNFPPALMAAASDCDLESIFFLVCFNPTI